MAGLRHVPTFDELVENYERDVGRVPDFNKKFPATAAVRSFAVQELIGVNLGNAQLEQRVAARQQVDAIIRDAAHQHGVPLHHMQQRLGPQIYDIATPRPDRPATLDEAPRPDAPPVLTPAMQAQMELLQQENRRLREEGRANLEEMQQERHQREAGNRREEELRQQVQAHRQSLVREERVRNERDDEILQLRGGVARLRGAETEAQAQNAQLRGALDRAEQTELATAQQARDSMLGLQAAAAREAAAAARDQQLVAELQAAQTQAYNRGVELREAEERTERGEALMARHVFGRAEDAIAARDEMYEQHAAAQEQLFGNILARAHQQYHHDVNILQAQRDDAAAMAMHQARALHDALHEALRREHIAEGQRNALAQALLQALHWLQQMRERMQHMDQQALAGVAGQANRLQQLALEMVQHWREIQQMPPERRQHLRDLLMQAMQEQAQPPQPLALEDVQAQAQQAALALRDAQPPAPMDAAEQAAPALMDAAEQAAPDGMLPVPIEADDDAASVAATEAADDRAAQQQARQAARQRSRSPAKSLEDRAEEVWQTMSDNGDDEGYFRSADEPYKKKAESVLRKLQLQQQDISRSVLYQHFPSLPNVAARWVFGLFPGKGPKKNITYLQTNLEYAEHRPENNTYKVLFHEGKPAGETEEQTKARHKNQQQQRDAWKALMEKEGLLAPHPIHFFRASDKLPARYVRARDDQAAKAHPRRAPRAASSGARGSRD
jgi:hypothetical protein